MLNLYEDYASREERENAVMLEQAEIELDKSILAFETADQMSELKMREAECRLVMESGDVSTLIDYYEEATAPAEEKKEGLIQRIWQAILNVIEKVKNFITGSSRKNVDPNAQVEVDTSFFERHQKLGAVVDAIKKFLAKPIAKFAAIILAATSIIATFLLIKNTGKKKKIKAGELNAAVDKEESLLDEIKNGVKGIFNKKIDKDAEGAPSVISKVVNAIKDNIKNAIDAMKEKRNAAKSEKIKRKMTGKNDTTHGKIDSLTAPSDWTYESAEESAKDDDIFGDVFKEDAYEEDAGDLSDIADLLATL